MTIRVLFTDANLAPISDPVVDWIDVDSTKRFRYPDTIAVTLPARPELITAAQVGHRLAIIRNGQFWSAGPIEKPGDYDWSQDDTDTSGLGQIVVYASDDSVLIARDRSYPDPTLDAADQNTFAYWQMTDNVETVLRAIVNLNKGPDALAYRQIPQLVLGDVAGVGASVIASTRFEPLGDLQRRLAIAGGVGYRVRQVGSHLVYEVYAPRDLTTTARFSKSLGNLRGISYRPTAPSATVAIVGGDGTGTSRTLVEVVDADLVAEYGRIVTFVNHDSDDVDELTQAGQDALAQATAQGQLSVTAIETPTLRFGTDVDLGDQVSVLVRDGAAVADVVTAVRLHATPKTGEQIEFTIGTGSASTDRRYVKALELLERRLGIVERR